MPIHLIAIDTYGSPPAASGYEVGYPIIHEGLIKKVNAAQDGWDVVGAGKVTTVTAAHTVTDTERVILADATGGAFEVTLPTDPYEGQSVTVKKIDGAANNVTVATPAEATPNTIDGTASVDLTTQNEVVRIVSDGIDWFVV